jgi:hypothetical protein
MPARTRKPHEPYWYAEPIARHPEKFLNEITASYTRWHGGQEPSEGEKKSWRESVVGLAELLTRIGLGSLCVFVEYSVYDMAPIDVVIAGTHPQGMLSFAVIELKRHSDVKRPDISVTKKGLCVSCRAPGVTEVCSDCAKKVLVNFGDGWAHKKHPAVQVTDNMIALQRYHARFDDRYVHLAGAIYLHNLLDEEPQWVSNISPDGKVVPSFTSRRPADFEEFLKESFTAESGSRAAQALLEQSRPELSITKEVGEIVNGRTQFSLVGTQKMAVDAVMTAVQSPPPPGAKKVFVIQGRAGTGKSLIAFELLGLAKAEHSVCYVSGGVASRDTFSREVEGGTRYFHTLNFLAKENDENHEEIDLVLCDEAHRLPERPMKGSYSMRDGASSVAVAVARTKVPVFFIDGDQRLFGEEIWTPEALIKEIKRLGAEVVPITLDRVLRSVGSATYDTWVRHLFTDHPLAWDAGDPPDPFELYYAESPMKMERFLRQKEAAGQTARIAAGIAWKWSNLNPDGTLVPDVKIGGWARPWNAPDQHPLPGVPMRKYWATGQGGLGQIGCVHTAQGLEYEWGGVIMGPDLTWDGDRWAVHRELVLSKANRIRSDEELRHAIFRAYRVLMTRSIRGTVLYSVDPDTRELFARLGLPKV